MRKATAHSISEIPVVLFVLLVLILFPLLDLCCVTFRSTFVDGAARNAAHVACKAHTFLADSEDGESAKTLAVNEVTRCVSHFSGIRVQKITPRVVRTSLTNPADRHAFEQPLPTVPDSDRYTYQLEVEVKAEVDPLIPFTAIIGEIPGLSKPLPVTATSRELFENIFWLTK